MIDPNAPLVFRPKDRRLLYTYGPVLILCFALSIGSMILLVDYETFRPQEWTVVVLGMLLFLTSIMVAKSAFALHTYLDVTPEQISTTRLPSIRARTLVIPRGKVTQLFITEAGAGFIFRTRPVYNVNLQLDNGVGLRVAGGISTYELAHSIEREIERYWKIPDQPVAGEIRK